METSDYLRYLAADAARLREVAGRDLTAAVPSCPGWTSADLVRHVASVYLHKIENMRTGAPAEWPPPVEEQPPLALLDRAYAELVGEFSQRTPESPSYTWYEPDQTVGFWIRRMAQETAIHRVDAELALGGPVTPVPDELALDGIDEVLHQFLAYSSVRWREEFGPELSEADGCTVLVDAAGCGWLARMEPSGVLIEPGAGAADTGSAAAGRVGGDPHSVLLWLWRRVDGGAVTREGDAAATERLRGLLATATQ